MNGGNVRPRIVCPEEKRKPGEIVKALELLLFGTNDYPEQERLAPEGRALTLTWEQFQCVTGYKAMPKYLPWNVEWEATDSWIVIGYGADVVLIGTDFNHAPVE